MKDLVSLCLCFITLSSFSLKGSFCFFLKHSSGRCIRSASKPYLSTERAKLWYLELTNDCTDPGAQFRFVNDGVLHHTSSTGCVLPSDGKSLPSVGTKLVVFAAKDVCTNKSSQAYTQTQFGSLRHASLKCIQPHRSFTSVPRAGAQIEYTAVCNETLQNFMLGSVTCEGNKARNINCPASQVVKITKANYGGYGSIKTCGYNRNYNCLLPSSLCNVKRQCDGFQSCEVEASMSEFQHDACPGMKKYLYLEYECVDRSEFKKENMIIKKVRLAADSTPGHGYVELLEESEPNVWQRLCREDMKDTEKEVICRTLGYSGLKEEQSSVGSGQEVGEDLKMPVLHGNVYCNSHDTNVSSCCLQKVNSEESACSMMARVACAICVEPVLSGDNHPPVVFTASSSLPSHSADKAAMTSGSTWCARGTGDDARDHLKIDLSDTYVITQLAMLGDEPRGNWVESYEVLYSKDKSDWLPGIANGQNLLTGNSASDELSTVVFDAAIHARFIKIFPKSWRGRACLKLEICGHRLLPAAPINITLSSITAYTAGLTWIKPADTGDGSFTEYQISLFRDETLDSNKTTKSGWWHFETLRPYTQYTVAIQAGNEHDFGRKAELTFKTNSTAPTAPPMNIKLSPISSTALSISWKPPPPVHRNGIITGYEVCFARVGSDEPCDRVIRTTASSIRVGYLWPTTEYKLRVFARNDAGSGNYSDEYLQITNSEAPVCNRSSISKEMFIVKLQKPREEVRFCQVIVTALQSEGSFPGQELYSAEAVTYLEASGSAPGPYIAAEFLASDFEEYQNFTIGDRTMFPALSSVDTLKRSQAKKYFNGPLTANTRYTLFQRFFSDKKLLYSSDFLAPVKTVSKVSKATETNIQAQSENSSVTSFKVPFILMTVSTIILLLIIACFLLLKWRQRRQHATVPPSTPPTNIQLKVESSTALVVSWKALVLRNITGYQVCIAHVQSDEECEMIVRTKASTCVARGLKTASRYKVKVSARNEVGYGRYSQDYITITNAAPPDIVSSKITIDRFVVKLEPPRKEIRYCQIVLITLSTNVSLPSLSQYLEDQPSSYIAAEFDIVDFKKYRVFTVGDGRVTLGVVGLSKFSSAVRRYLNEPLSPGTMYTVFQRFYTEQSLMYVSDFLLPTKTKQKDNFERFKGHQGQSKSSREDEFKLPFIIVIVLLLVILLIFGVIVIYKRRQTQQNNVSVYQSATIEQTENDNEQENSPAVV